MGFDGDLRTRLSVPIYVLSPQIWGSPPKFAYSLHRDSFWSVSFGACAKMKCERSRRRQIRLIVRFDEERLKFLHRGNRWTSLRNHYLSDNKQRKPNYTDSSPHHHLSTNNVTSRYLPRAATSTARTGQYSQSSAYPSAPSPFQIPAAKHSRPRSRPSTSTSPPKKSPGPPPHHPPPPRPIRKCTDAQSSLHSRPAPAPSAHPYRAALRHPQSPARAPQLFPPPSVERPPLPEPYPNSALRDWKQLGR